MVLVECTYLFLYYGKNLTKEAFFLPILNLIVCLLLEYIVLKVFCATVLFKDRERYLVINDTEFELLKLCKQENKPIYMHAVHTAYLSEKLAAAIEMESPKIKTAAYYMHIEAGIEKNPTVDEEKKKDYYETLCEKYQFPEDAQKLLLECISKHGPCRTIEAALVQIADTMITTLMYLFERDAKLTLDYPKIVKELIKKKTEEHLFDECPITIAQLKTIENTLLKETLYYDFLR